MVQQRKLSAAQEKKAVKADRARVESGANIKRRKGNGTTLLKQTRQDIFILLISTLGLFVCLFVFFPMRHATLPAIMY